MLPPLTAASRCLRSYHLATYQRCSPQRVSSRHPHQANRRCRFPVKDRSFRGVGQTNVGHVGSCGSPARICHWRRAEARIVLVRLEPRACPPREWRRRRSFLSLARSLFGQRETEQGVSRAYTRHGSHYGEKSWDAWRRPANALCQNLQCWNDARSAVKSGDAWSIFEWLVRCDEEFADVRVSPFILEPSLCFLLCWKISCSLFCSCLLLLLR
jgi:hypothetical protein